MTTANQRTPCKQTFPTVAAVVLAAGMSQRMGRLKPLLPFGDRSMLARVLENIETAENISPIILVTGNAAQEIEGAARDYNVSPIYNADYAQGGMLSSVRQGLQALPPACGAFFLVLGDQPGVRPATLQALRRIWRETESLIVLPTCNGKRGHPVLFSAQLAPEIIALPPDATLKTVVTRHAAEAREVAVLDPAILFDIDTPEDYERALRAFHESHEP